MNKQGKRKVIGVTGGLATGKTTVADMFVAKGAKKIDADDIAHRLLAEDDDIRKEVIGLFGEEILTEGGIDRRKLAKNVFFDRQKLEALCRILHPAIIRNIKEEVRRNEDSVIVVDAPLLIEAGLQDLVDIVVVVTAERETQITRAASRGISGEEAEKIVECQMPLSEKSKFADYVIDNNMENLETIKEGVDKIWQEM